MAENEELLARAEKAEKELEQLKAAATNMAKRNQDFEAQAKAATAELEALRRNNEKLEEATAEAPVTIDAMMRHIFKKYDKDKSGFIDQAELKDVLRDLSIKFTEEQAASLYKSMDRNGTGQIEIEEVSFRID